MKFEISPFASDEEKLLEINETLESIKDVLAEMVFDMEDEGRDVSTLEDALDALEDAIDGINDAIDLLTKSKMKSWNWTKRQKMKKRKISKAALLLTLQ